MFACYLYLHFHLIPYHLPLLLCPTHNASTLALLTKIFQRNATAHSNTTGLVQFLLCNQQCQSTEERRITRRQRLNNTADNYKLNTKSIVTCKTVSERHNYTFNRYKAMFTSVQTDVKLAATAKIKSTVQAYSLDEAKLYGTRAFVNQPHPSQDHAFPSEAQYNAGGRLPVNDN